MPFIIHHWTINGCTDVRLNVPVTHNVCACQLLYIFSHADLFLVQPVLE